jgi:S1-C subfamily serine protease
MRFWAIAASIFFIFTSLSLPAMAQQTSWLQVEAVPDQATAIERAKAYSALFPNVEGYESGAWFAIALGPMTRDEAGQMLLSLRHENLIPLDSYIASGAGYGAKYWPVAGEAPLTEADPEALPEATSEVEPEAEVIAPEVATPEETLAEARAAEDAFSRDEKMALQVALAWFGFYDGTIDGAYGKGTRGSFAAWQEANGYEATGVLRSDEGVALLGAEATEKALYGFDLVSEIESGIEVMLPMGLVAFQGYEPPFVQFAPRESGGPRLILISEPGDQASLSGLYDLLQTMEIVPASGERSLSADGFVITATSPSVATYAWARASKGQVKGFILSWTPQNAKSMARIVEVVQSSFRSVGDKALDPGLVPLDEAARQGLLTGLTPLKPAFSRSGFYVSSEGAILTLATDLQNCTEITIDGDIAASLVASDAASGAALLKPEKVLSPVAIANFATSSVARGSEIVVAGYAYGDKLPAPVLTYGRLDEATGLAGETGVSRLSAPVLEGDQGGPVLSVKGAVIGLLSGPSADPAKSLPAGVVFAADAAAVTGFLSGNGISAQSFTGPDLSPAALSKAALGMTLRVDCWK